MRTKIVRWGNSLGLRIPKTFAEEVDVRDGSAVDLSLVDGKLVVRPFHGGIELEALLADVTETNLHDEVSFGAPRGRERW